MKAQNRSEPGSKLWKHQYVVKQRRLGFLKHMFFKWNSFSYMGVNFQGGPSLLLLQQGKEPYVPTGRSTPYVGDKHIPPLVTESL